MGVIHIIQTSIVKRDGGNWFSGVPWTEWERWGARNPQQQVNIGINSLLLEMGGKWILIDAGLGNGSNLGDIQWQLARQLHSLGVNRRRIPLVIITNPSLEHGGGLIYGWVWKREEVCPTFPRAVILGWGLPDTTAKLAVEPLTSGVILPGLEAERMDGSVVIRAAVGGERIIFASDIIPTAEHLRPGCLPSSVSDRAQAERLKAQLRDEAIDNGSLMIFAHGLNVRAGYVERTRDGVQVRPVNLS